MPPTKHLSGIIMCTMHLKDGTEISFKALSDNYKIIDASGNELVDSVPHLLMRTEDFSIMFQDRKIISREDIVSAEMWNQKEEPRYIGQGIDERRKINA